jgi:hypothetical protein
VRFASDDNTTQSQRPLLTLVISSNPLPTVTAAASLSATNGVAAALSGTVSGATGSLWARVSGPGSAVFGNAAQAATTVTFSQPGNYVLRLSGSNASGETCAEIAITVAANPNLYADWQGLKWPGVSDPSIIGPNADPDRDGIPNLVEFALYLSPITPGKLPAGLVKNGANLEFTYIRARNAAGVTYQVEWSDTLAPGSWSTTNVSESVVAPDTDPDLRTIKATVPAGTGKRFLRLKITQ